MNAFRPRSDRSLPSAASWRSTTFWVAMPAWSVPGTHSTSCPSMRLKRHNTSWRVLFRACPMWREPVTLGGGITMEKDGAPEPAGAKWSAASQRAYHSPSTC